MSYPSHQIVCCCENAGIGGLRTYLGEHANAGFLALKGPPQSSQQQGRFTEAVLKHACTEPAMTQRGSPLTLF